ncbi:hypothetical protein ACFX14_023947 [Malus domestica]
MFLLCTKPYATKISKQKEGGFDFSGENDPSSNGNAYTVAYKFDDDEEYVSYGVSGSSIKLRLKVNPTGRIDLLKWTDDIVHGFQGGACLLVDVIFMLLAVQTVPAVQEK